MSATIIDFSAYRTNRRIEGELSPNGIGLELTSDAALDCSFYWSFLAWIPFGLPDLTAAERESW
jgi:hypothetical protein